MAGPAPPRCQREAFNFDNTQRNASLVEKGVKVQTLSTGTTIVGCVYKDGIVLGADTRASAGSIVADKKCQKIHYLAPNIYGCGAGTAADCDHVTRMVESSLALFRLENGKENRVRQAETLLKRHLNRYQGYVGAHIVLGGVDVNGPHLCAISAHGYVKRHMYLTMGSGSLAAQAVLDSRYKDGCSEQEAKDLVHDAIAAGILNDLGSGGTIDLCVIKREDPKAPTKVDYFRPYHELCVERPYQRKNPMQFPKGTTGILTEEVKQLFTVEEAMVEG